MADVPVKKKGWSTGKKIGVGIGIVVGAFFALIIGTAAYLLSTGQVPVDTIDLEQQVAPVVQASSSADGIFGISDFGVTKQGSIYQAHFQLSDDNLSPRTANAHVNFTITAVESTVDLRTARIIDNASTIYSSLFNVSESEFGDYTRTFTGADSGKMYLWVIEGSEIDDKIKGDPAGKAFITVTLENGKSFKADDIMYFG